MGPTFQDVKAAADVVGGGIAQTPCLVSHTLSELTGATVILKFENHQFTASFKERGALTALLALTAAERRLGVIAPSAGNHAQGLAYHAQRLGIACTLVMPRFTPNVKVMQTQAFGAKVILEGETFADAEARARALAKDSGQVLVHPYDDARVIAGQGTVALEMLATFPDLDVLVAPVGGGGLLSGMVLGARGLRPDITLYGVQTRSYPGVFRALRGLPDEVTAPTIAEGIAVKRPGELTLWLLRQSKTEVLLVEEGDLEEAVLLLLEVEKTVVEGAAAAPLAALMHHRALFEGKKVGLVLSGGNIDPMLLGAVIERGMVRTGRLARVRVCVRDLPGALSDVTEVIGNANANIQEVQHQRAFTTLPLQTTEVDFVLRTRDQAHVAEVLNALRAAGYPADLHNR